MRIQFNRKFILHATSMVAAAGAISLFTQGCVPCDPEVEVCSATPINIKVTPNGNAANTAFEGAGEVIIETTNADASEADVFYSFGATLPDKTCPDVYDYTGIAIMDDVQMMVTAVSESEALQTRNSQVLNFYVNNPTFPNAALKDKWLVDELDIFEKHFLCAAGYAPWDLDGPDAVTGRCDYPNFSGMTPSQVSNFLFIDKTIIGACENAGSGTVRFVYDVEDPLPLTPDGAVDIEKLDIALSIIYDNCSVNGATYDGTTELTTTAIGGVIDVNTTSTISVNADVDGTFTETGAREYALTLEENLKRRTGVYSVECSNGGCADGPVTWSAPTRASQGQFWFNDPRMVAGCPTSNVEAND